MVALGDYFAILQQVNMVQVDDCADALGDIDGGGTMHEIRDSLLDAAFGGSIQGTGAVIQDDDLWFSGRQGPPTFQAGER